jgi:hypothetical protein
MGKLGLHGIEAAFSPAMSMPEIAVDKYRESDSGEDDVRTAGHSGHMQPISKSSPMKFSAQEQLRLSVLAPDRSHDAAGD